MAVILGRLDAGSAGCEVESSSKDWSGEGRLLLRGFAGALLLPYVKTPLVVLALILDGCFSTLILDVGGAGGAFLLEAGVRKKLATWGDLVSVPSSMKVSQPESMWEFMFVSFTGLPHIGQLTISIEPDGSGLAIESLRVEYRVLLVVDFSALSPRLAHQSRPGYGQSPIFDFGSPLF